MKKKTRETKLTIERQTVHRLGGIAPTDLEKIQGGTGQTWGGWSITRGGDLSNHN